MKNYFKYTLKRFVPLFAVTFAICFAIFLSAFASFPSYHITYDGGYHTLSLDTGGVLILAIPLAIMTIFLPLFANTYRYSIKAADVFYQIGKGKKSIRFVNNLTILSACILSFTASFIFGVLIVMLKQLPNLGREPIVEDYGETTRTITFIIYNYIYYLPTYFMLVIFGILNYFISYFLVTRANNFVNSLIMLILGNVILGFGIIAPIWFVSVIVRNTGYNVTSFYNANMLGGMRTIFIVGPISLVYYLFDSLIVTGNSCSFIEQLNNAKTQDIFSIVLAFLCLVIFIIVGIISIMIFLKEKESSGELCGKAVGRGKLQNIIFHMGFAIIGFLMTLLQTGVGIFTTIGVLNFLNIASFISSIIFFGAIYYVFTGLIRRNFRLDKVNLIALLSGVSANAVLGIFLIVITSSNAANAIGY